MARLVRAAEGTKNQLSAARAAKAVSRLEADGKSWRVEVPALDVAASGAIYDQLRDNFRVTLGLERLETFGELAGENFERSFDNFGLSPVVYEIAPPSPVPHSNHLMFLEFKRHFYGTNGAAMGWTSGRYLLGDIEKSDGLLAKIPPPALQAGEVRP